MRDTETWTALDGAERTVGALRVVAGPDTGLSIVLEGGRRTLGSGVAADVRLRDPSVSRLHAELVDEEAGVHLIDLGSKNGTFIGGCRVGEAWLAPGARVSLGATVLEADRPRRVASAAGWTGGDLCGDLIGASPAAHALFAAIERVARSDVRVLVRGASGTGKELVAREIHRRSERRDGPFVVVDGAALRPTLADDELFGHVRGAFTGAGSDKPGAFERADGGTLFLDEVGELPLEVQAKLLRAIDTGSVQRLGAGERAQVSVRVVAATHRPLERMVNEGTFREDLLHRLLVASLHVPPLRDRHGDVPLLARTFLGEIDEGEEAAAALDDALAARAGYLWPGNVRELRNFVQRVALLGSSSGDALPRSDELPRVDVGEPFREAKERWTEIFERQYVTRILEETRGNVSEAARRAGLSRVHMAKLAKRWARRR